MPKKRPKDPPEAVDQCFWTCGKLKCTIGSSAADPVLYNYNQLECRMRMLACTCTRHAQCVTQGYCGIHCQQDTTVAVRKYHGLSSYTWRDLPEVEQRTLRILAQQPGKDALAACRPVRVQITELEES